MDSVLATAMHWQHLGVAPIPVRPKSKTPAIPWKHLQFTLPTRRQVRRWFGRGRKNLGLLTGVASDNLVVLDFDLPLQYHKWTTAHPENATTHTVATRRGYHVYFRLEELPCRSLSMMGGAGEVKSSGYVLAPPSTHPSGVPYRALNAPRIALRASLDELGISVYPKGDKHRSELPEGHRAQSVMPGDGPVAYIKATYPITDYLERFSALHHSGGAFFMCCCPLHDDRRPSMWVNAKLGVCRCFKHGCAGAERVMDVISLHARLRGISNTEAIYNLGTAPRSSECSNHSNS